MSTRATKKKPTPKKKPRPAGPPIPTADPTRVLPPEFQNVTEMNEWLTSLVATLANVTLELHAPIPTGLTERQVAALLRQRAASRVEAANVEGIVWGALVALRRSGKLPHVDFVAAHEALLGVTRPPRAVEVPGG